MKQRIVIIRHGNTFEKDTVVRRIGITDIQLVAFGREQIENLAQHFQNSSIHADLILSSPLKRTYETAKILQKYAQSSTPLILENTLREINYGPDENVAEEDVKKRLGMVLTAWNDSGIMPKDWPESVENIQKRWEDILNKCLDLYPQHACIFIVTSNGLARFLPQLSCIKNTLTLPKNLSTAHYGILEYDGTTWQTLSWNNSYVPH